MRQAQKRLEHRIRLGRKILLVGSFIAMSGSCRTLGINGDALLNAFNNGATDSFPDPALDASTIAEERVAVTAKVSLIRGFASQGSSPGSAPSIAIWLKSSAIQDLAWMHVQNRKLGSNAVVTTPAAPGTSAHNVYVRSVAAQAGATSAVDDSAKSFHNKLFNYLLTTTNASDRLPSGNVCEAKEATNAGRLYADAARLAASLDVASIDVARMLTDEGVVTEDQAHAGLKRAMDEASDYLANRKWHPSDRVPTFGLTIKGGASTGVYSAGVVWRALTLIQRYREWKAHEKPPYSDSGIGLKEARFSITSGTSAGAIIAAVVDMFDQEKCVIAKGGANPGPAHGEACEEYARHLMATLFTCPNQSALYCIDSRPIWNLAGSQKGLMDFDGLRNLLSTYVGTDVLENHTELVLTTVDFRWGGLYTQSDQDPSTVERGASAASLDELHKSIEASFVLPFIAWPVKTLRIGGQPRDGVFLDGGIRSEIPINALSERGVDRVLVVGSAPPEITPTAAQDSALAIAARYLDESLAGTTEGEWRTAVPRARYIEAFEASACDSLFSTKGVSPPTDLDAFCEGSLEQGCGGHHYDPGAGAASYKLPSSVAGGIARHEAGRKFDMMGIFRNESIAPTYGYSFDPVQMRRLFNTGVNAARDRCIEMALFLGMGDAGNRLDDWCNETPKVEEGFCPKPTEDTDRACTIDPEHDTPPR